MNIHFHIDRLVLDGLPISNVQASALRAVAEVEMARQLAENGLRQMPGGAIPHLSAGSIEWPEGGNVSHLGQQIARAVFQGVNNASPSPSPARGAKS